MIEVRLKIYKGKGSRGGGGEGRGQIQMNVIPYSDFSKSKFLTQRERKEEV